MTLRVHNHLNKVAPQETKVLKDDSKSEIDVDNNEEDNKTLTTQSNGSS